ncbi:unnamed protein product [Caenorhabditis auriculariae]|uniref:Uncharacterized protein n=1 Tax=Caenorhabditis auriculariae TaxID=2777116 RepID=A0A8S1HAM7_9PELO|nr:unnamed protein product [Caenorhabditis auriculariae]
MRILKTGTALTRHPVLAVASADPQKRSSERHSFRIRHYMISLLVFLVAASFVEAAVPVRGTMCSKNQVVRKLTVYEDGALEAECGPVPCGEAGRRCIEDQTSCRAETDVFSGMRWAANGESILMRCCTMKTKEKIYVGTDIVSAGSFYEGGPVSEKDLYGSEGGSEYDFIANARIEQGGVRVWVYRMICKPGEKPIDFEPITTPAPFEPDVVTTRLPTTTTTTEAPVMEESQDEKEEETESDNEKTTEDVGATEDEEESEDEGEETEEPTTTTLEPRAFNPLRYRPPHVPRSTGVRRA